MECILNNENPLRVGLMGFGQTGKAVATILLKDPKIRLEWVIRKSHKLEHRSVPEFLGIDSDEPGLIYPSSEFTAEELLKTHAVDAIIDFSSEDGLEYYAEAAAQKGVTIVSAISAYTKSKVDYLKNLGARTRVLWSPNITLGINFMILAAKTLKSIAPSTDVEIIEEHFKFKPETSGTAMRIAKSLKVEPKKIKSIRAGGIIGVHEILFGFPFQTVRLKHESISREAFGNGAKFAVEQLVKRDKGFYTMEELLGPYFVDTNMKYSNGQTPVTKSLALRMAARIRGLLGK
ncbi:MAG: 4-hydroxy-tetrahydrodipicolinate reductase [Luteolibacter sp.]